jgi:hypothetical protein
VVSFGMTLDGKPVPDPRPTDAAAALLTEVDALPVRDTPAMRALRKQASARWRRQSADFIIAMAFALGERPDARWLGYELVRRHPPAFASLDDRTLETMSIGLDSWSAVDAFARILSGPAWARGLASDGLIQDWAGSADRWRRRTALVSTVALNTPADGGAGDAGRTLALCARLSGDRDDMVEKALSWALRALAIRNRAAVRAFLAAEDARLAARVKREVRNKLDTGLKTPRRV